MHMTGKKDALHEAISKVMQFIGDKDVEGLGKGKSVVEVEVEPESTHLAEGEEDGEDSYEDCPDCAAGTCDNPAHEQSPANTEEHRKDGVSRYTR